MKEVVFLLSFILLNIADAIQTDASSSAEDEFHLPYKSKYESFETIKIPINYARSKDYQDVDPFWKHPIANLPNWKSKDDIGNPRFPTYDPNYPVWMPGYPNRPGTDAKTMYRYKPALHDLSVEIVDKRDNDEREGNEANVMSSGEVKQFKKEVKAGDLTHLFGSNRHVYQPATYRFFDLGRRFIPQYPYEDVGNQKFLAEIHDTSLIPKKASPEQVLAVAKESALLEASKPVNPSDDLIQKSILRSGNYWNYYWQEDVDDPVNTLREKKPEKLQSISAKLSPGTPIYKFVSKLNKIRPKLLYVVNKNN